MATITALFFFAFLSVAFGRLFIIESGPSGKLGPQLKDGFRFCPRKFSNRGFSIECRLPKDTRYAVISVNGRDRIDRSAPYRAAGDSGMAVHPLRVSEGRLTVSCKSSTGHRLIVTGTISCAPGKTSSPSYPRVTPSPSSQKSDVASTPELEISPSPEFEIITSEIHSSPEPEVSPELEAELSPTEVTLSHALEISPSPELEISPSPEMEISPEMESGRRLRQRRRRATRRATRRLPGGRPRSRNAM